MTLTPEDGTGLSVADSYVSLVEANAYHAGRDSDIEAGWFAATVAAQEAGLREATAYLDGTYTWVGSLLVMTQVLGWPRTSAYDHEGRLLPSNAVPRQIKDATAYLAFQGLGAALQPTSTSASGAIKRKKVASLEIEYFEGSSASSTARVFSEVNTLLRGLYISGPGSGISGNVIRWS